MNNHSTKDKDAISSNGMAATSHPIATEEALRILQKGGNAVDAAIAASVVLSVAEPNATSIGGDCFAIIKMNGKDPVSYNGSGIAPAKANFDYFKEKNIDKIGLTSPHAVTIPGALDAWNSIHNDFGKLDFEELFHKGIDIAKNGFKVTKVVANAWSNVFNKLNDNPYSRKHMLNNGKSYQFNEVNKNPALGETLEKISKNGVKEFYEGSIAEDLVKTLKEFGGLHTIEDFHKQKTIKSDTLSDRYRDIIIHQCPPSGPGITVLVMMKLLEKLGIEKYDVNSFERFHLEAEVTKQAYKLKEENIGDPEFVDRDLNVVSIINSVCYAFGSGITGDKSGVVLHNRGTNFRVEEGHPNCIQGLKRPLHTIIPGIVMNNKGECELSYGVMGGQYQPVGQVHVLNSIIDYNLTPQQAISFPRAFHFNNIYKLEKSIDEKIFNNLKEVGHNVEYIDGTHGGGQAIQIDREKGNLVGGSDPRKDGYAKGY